VYNKAALKLDKRKCAKRERSSDALSRNAIVEAGEEVNCSSTRSAVRRTNRSFVQQQEHSLSQALIE
jgi:hypothetical protein